jgi:hypothetical protein
LRHKEKQPHKGEHPLKCTACNLKPMVAHFIRQRKMAPVMGLKEEKQSPAAPSHPKTTSNALRDTQVHHPDQNPHVRDDVRNGLRPQMPQTLDGIDLPLPELLAYGS